MSGSPILTESDRHDFTVARPTWQLVVALALIALSIRLIDLGGRSLWVDEGATYVLSRPPLSEILRDDDSDTEHPPGYYALVHVVSRIDDSEAALRFPSALAAALGVATLYLVGKRLSGHRLGLLAAGVLALAPLDIWYAQEARQPIFAAASILIAVWGLVRGKWPGHILAVAALLTGLYLDYVTTAGWLGIGAVWLAFAERVDGVKFKDWLLVTAVSAAIYIPFQGAELAQGLEDLFTHSGPGIWYGDLLGSNPVTSNPFGLLAIGTVTTFGILRLGQYVTNHQRMGQMWAKLIIVGFALGSALLFIPRAYSVKKLVVVGWPLIVLLVATLLLSRISAGSRRGWVLTVLGLSAIGSIASFLVPKDDWRSATAYINEHAAPGDVAWVREDVWAADAYIYYEGKLPVFIDPEPGDDLPQGGEVWLITYRRPQDPAGVPSIEAEAWFDENWMLVEEAPFYRLAVRRYRSP